MNGWPDPQLTWVVYRPGGFDEAFCAHTWTEAMKWVNVDIRRSSEGNMSILDEAKSLINGQRRQDYGGITESFTVIAGMWAAYLGREITCHDVANLMVLLKTARARNGYHRDSYVDICGYAALTEVLDAEATTPEVAK
ncbi:DUF6378 domain-containing protein [Mycobacterium marinum]|uniref:DUF6378 domain-containing protein n=1 Tax=Mycobacterium marinum TaxID=1781 RepID=UPI001160BD7A|nr:DUF6378 domain-containing protein [Mycobacterium marinum]